MVKMGSVWDRTAEVLGGRLGMLATIAILALFIPALVSGAWTAFAVPATRNTVLIGSVLAIAALVAAIWGQLAILAVATDPATTQGDAMAQATARLMPALGIALLIAIVATLLTVPIFLVLNASGFNFAAAMNSQAAPQMAPGAAAIVGIYSIVIAVLILAIGARLTLVNPVVLNERRGLGAFLRSFALTRGYTWKLIGLVLLFAILLLVSGGAAKLIAGVVFRLILGPEAAVTVLFLAATVQQIVATGFTVVAAVFVAQLYLALRGPASAPE